MSEPAAKSPPPPRPQPTARAPREDHPFRRARDPAGEPPRRHAEEEERPRRSRQTDDAAFTEDAPRRRHREEEREAPDLIVLQDAARRGPVYRRVYMNHYLAGVGQFLLISKLPIRKAELVPLGTHEQSGETLRADTEAFWANQVKLADALVDHIRQDKRECLIAGDCNAPDHGVVYHLFTDKFPDACRARARLRLQLPRGLPHGSVDAAGSDSLHRAAPAGLRPHRGRPPLAASRRGGALRVAVAVMCILRRP